MHLRIQNLSIEENIGCHNQVKKIKAMILFHTTSANRSKGENEMENYFLLMQKAGINTILSHSESLRKNLINFHNVE